MSGNPAAPREQESVELALPPKPENAAVARRAVAEEAARAGLADGLAAAAKVVVTEGFTNATRHAYSEPEEERVVVRARGDDAGITVSITDSGGGFRPRPQEAGHGGGFGLSLIAALAERVELRRRPEGGMEIEARIERAPATG